MRDAAKTALPTDDAPTISAGWRRLFLVLAVVRDLEGGEARHLVLAVGEVAISPRGRSGCLAEDLLLAPLEAGVADGPAVARDCERGDEITGVTPVLARPLGPPRRGPW
jgi:hypothetical protein